MTATASAPHSDRRKRERRQPAPPPPGTGRASKAAGCRSGAPGRLAWRPRSAVGTQARPGWSACIRLARHRRLGHQRGDRRSNRPAALVARLRYAQVQNRSAGLNGVSRSISWPQHRPQVPPPPPEAVHRLLLQQQPSPGSFQHRPPGRAHLAEQRAHSRHRRHPPRLARYRSRVSSRRGAAPAPPPARRARAPTSPASSRPAGCQHDSQAAA